MVRTVGRLSEASSRDEPSHRDGVQEASSIAEISRGSLSRSDGGSSLSDP